ncbi:AraC family transcriptional regulator ligand-binding domain-containing protein [Rhizobiales bacterium]|uniref:AraC family transcriptional regulator n=1 Tax=Hongsoonwoonella zoysiae TaxID=2821844 RepID=UPI00155FF3D0|nr:AraC family transcriptional regulator [Hongsoonwoonella zoysiae]NRG17714.1 AraC family transcriptional regulator ligand-binding domain-containing protein [Hongsoonwoonella zoysiae]
MLERTASDTKFGSLLTGEDREAHLIRARELVGLPHYCAMLKIPLSPFLKQYQLSNIPAQPPLGSYIRLDDFCRLLDALATRARRETFSLDWTKWLIEKTPDPLDCQGADDTVCMAASYAPDLRSAIDVLASFASVSHDLAMAECVSEGATTALQWAFPPSISCRNQITDRIAGAYCRKLSMLAGDTDLVVSVELNRDRPVDAGPYREFFGPNISFNAPFNRIRVKTSALETPNPRANNDIFCALNELNRRRLADKRRAHTLVERTCEAIAAGLDDPDLTLSKVSRKMALSERGLQRRLSEEGATFQMLHDKVRRKAAEDLLTASDLSISDIAYRLGFKAVGNFTRAARRWFDRSPKEYRKDRQAAAQW